MGPTVAVIGIGYVGLATALSFARRGLRTICVDVNREKVDALNRGAPPFYEPGVKEALHEAIAESRLSATVDGVAAVREADYSFLCVGTPPTADGSMDPGFVRAAARTVGQGLRDRKGRHVVTVKSTVLPGTTQATVLPELREAAGPNASFGLCVNPEFLREGSALEDALNPDRIIIGELDAASGDALEALYADHASPKLRCDLRTAEMIKYATNAFLATKVSFANELANLCDRFGVDWDEVVNGLGLDPRINPRFMVPGVGFGGSCFPKDVAAIVAAGKREGYDAALLSAVLERNERQPLRAVEILREEVGDLAGKRVAVLGLAFKAGTDDVRESRAIPIIRELTRQGAAVVGYDPVAGPAFATAMPEVPLAKTAQDALRGAHGCIIQADWPEFRAFAAKDFAGMAAPVVVDGRRTLDRRALGGRVVYRRIG